MQRRIVHFHFCIFVFSNGVGKHELSSRRELEDEHSKPNKQWGTPESIVARMDRMEFFFFFGSFMAVAVVGELAPSRELKCS